MADHTKTLKRIIHAGTSQMTIRNYVTFLRELRIIMESRDYCLFTMNCRHVSRHILEKLDCTESQGIAIGFIQSRIILIIYLRL